MDDDIKKKIDNAVKDTDVIVATPQTIDKLKSMGLPIKEKFITYEEYVENLYDERKKRAVKRLTKLPKIDETIANSVITAIVEEIRSSYAFGNLTSVIFNSILLLEYSMKLKLHKERCKHDPNSKWSDVESLQMKPLINKLSEFVSKKEKKKLMDFSDNIRNPYLHLDILKLIDGIYLESLTTLDVSSGKLSDVRYVEAKENPAIWFSAKKFFDKTVVQYIVDFCFYWTNQLLKTK